MKNPFKRTLSDEDKHARRLKKAAFEQGRKRAREEKLRRQVTKAKKAGYHKEMDGRFGEVKGFLRASAKGANKILDAAESMSPGIERAFGFEEQPKKKKRKRKR